MVFEASDPIGREGISPQFIDSLIAVGADEEIIQWAKEHVELISSDFIERWTRFGLSTAYDLGHEGIDPGFFTKIEQLRQENGGENVISSLFLDDYQLKLGIFVRRTPGSPPQDS